MSGVNPKNFAMTAAALDLGLGGDLSEQLKAQEEKMRKARKDGTTQSAFIAPGSWGSASAMDLGLT